jgi:hypothetical protein
MPRPRRLDGLVESLPTARVLLLVTYRPEYQHAWAGKTYYSQLRLDPLPPESAEELLHAILGHEAGLEPLKQLLITTSTSSSSTMDSGGIRRSGISAPGPSSDGWITKHRQLNPGVYEIGASPLLASWCQCCVLGIRRCSVNTQPAIARGTPLAM